MAVSDILDATIGQPVDYPSDLVEINDDVFVEVRALSYVENKEIRDGALDFVWPDGMTREEAAKKDKIDTKFDTARYEIDRLMACCYDPDSGERVFGEEHREQLEQQPGHDGHWFTRLLDACDRLNKAGNLSETSAD